jgi:phage terminase large subunit GpA-like protein
MTAQNPFIEECEQFLVAEFQGLTDTHVTTTVSEWAESTRYLPASVTSLPGFYSFDVAPYIREIADCFSLSSPVRQVAVQKGVQLGLSVGIIENAIGYEIEHVKKLPCMLVTADAELAQTVTETRILTMISASGLDDLIQSNDDKNSRKTGRTSKKLEWQGGGFLLPHGANNPSKLRSMSIARLFFDEIDAFPQKLKNEGDPVGLAKKRTAAFEDTRKICYISTPLVAQTSKIEPLYYYGDQRRFFVPCKHCGEHQTLEWHGVTDDGVVFGLQFDVDDDGAVVEESVGYCCKFCHKIMRNYDKSWFLSRGEWRATAKAKEKGFRSYHISTLYSPVGFSSWVEMARDWVKAWDVKNNKVRDIDALQEFYNLNLGKTFEVKTESLKFERVVLHRRSMYASGQIPNKNAIAETGSEILALVCSVDVHKTHLDIKVCGFTVGRRMYSIEWLVVEGDCLDITANDSPWQKLREIIESKIYIADDGKQYRVQLTLIDAGYEQDKVLEFCGEYAQGVVPIMGRKTAGQSAKLTEFYEFTTKLGTIGFNVNTGLYKDRLSNALRRDWQQGAGFQPNYHPNFPADYPDDFFQQLTVEYKAAVKNKTTGQVVGYQWHRPNGAANHSWDLSVYCSAAFDMLAYNFCMLENELDYLDWPFFYENCQNGLFYVD